MNTTVTQVNTWLTGDKDHIHAWIEDLRLRVDVENDELIKPIQEFKDLVESYPELSHLAQKMFTVAA